VRDVDLSLQQQAHFVPVSSATVSLLLSVERLLKLPFQRLAFLLKCASFARSFCMLFVL
jgi:hypothetical protein